MRRGRHLCAVVALAMTVEYELRAGPTTFPEPFDSEKSSARPMPAAEAAAAITLPPGFHATAFAAEPDVRQPIAMTTDPRGRLWVAENYTYAESAVNYHAGLRDRIVIFEDADNDGRFDRRTVFWEEGQRLTSIEVGLGGIWALCPPQLLFIPDRDGDGVPDGPAEVVLDGFDYSKARHTIASGLKWGPDGWLYGRHGILGTSRVGVPGAPDAERTTMNVGIWRYHPIRRRFERVAEGTTNPWGLDWDAHGEAFFINTVIGHLWHVIPGAHYRRMFGDDPDPHVYECLEQHADHVHWATGEMWTDVRRGATDQTLAAGGGHAHSGLLIYQGGQWPAAWNGKLLTVNFHGRRLNVERLERMGGGYVGRHEPDAFQFADPWFRGVDVIAAPDGGVFVSDWSDTGECHDHDGVSRSTGRIFKLVYGERMKAVPLNLEQLAGRELARLQQSSNDWQSRQARRVLASRAASGADLGEAIAELRKIDEGATNAVHRLRALWALHVSNATDLDRLRALEVDRDEHVRAWALRLLLDKLGADSAAWRGLAQKELPARARDETSGLVRLTLASLLQSLPSAEREPLAAALLTHAEDANDANIPLMLWYGIAPLFPLGAPFDRLVESARIPRVQRLGARRLAEEIDSAPERISALLEGVARSDERENQLAVLDGLEAGLSGCRRASPPPGWPLFVSRLSDHADDATRTRLGDLGAVFGDGRALAAMRATALNPNGDLLRRRGALKALVEVRPPDLREICEQLLPVRDLAVVAALGLASYDDPRIGERLLAEWPHFNANERPPIMDVLVSRPTWAAKTLAAIGKGRVSRADLSVSQARQITGYALPELTTQLGEVWGVVRDLSGPEKTSVLAQWDRALSADRLSAGDPAKGRVVFQATCAVCHMLNGQGAAIGPDLTGANRNNREYLLENILFPSALVAREYRQTTLTLRDGRVLVGSLRGRSTKALKLQTVSEVLTVATSDVAKEETSSLSLMPEGLLDAIGEGAAADLFAYLMSK